jgi:hypothetical protein
MQTVVNRLPSQDDGLCLAEIRTSVVVHLLSELSGGFFLLLKGKISKR